MNSSHSIQVEGLNIHYRSQGEGSPVLLVHGWPTSSFLWRHTMAPIAAHNTAIAIDLPGFGHSDKPLTASYSFRFYERVLSGFLDALDIKSVGLAVHDLGGPVGLYWALHNRARVERLALLNTLVYPEMSWAVAAFVAASYLPGLRTYMTSRSGLALAMKIGVSDPALITPEVVAGVADPFTTRDARRALLKAAHSLHPGGFREIAKRLPSYAGAVRIIYGAEDRILPDVAKTMERVATDLPQAEATSLPNCGHFLQEERGQEIGEMLSAFFTG